jgi:hypothetical protein
MSDELATRRTYDNTHFTFSGMASHRIFGIWVQSTAMNVPGVYFGVRPRKLLNVSDQGDVNAFVVHCSTSWLIAFDDASVVKAARRIIAQRSMLGGAEGKEGADGGPEPR